MLHLVSKQAYKLKLPKWWKIDDIFHISLLEQNITEKRRIDKTVIELEFKVGNSKNYKVKVIWDNAVYANKVVGNLLGLYYLVA